MGLSNYRGGNNSDKHKLSMYGSEVYDKVNTAWKATCRVLLKEEIGELNEYKDWLQDYAGVPRKEKSTLSGKQVTFSIDEYCKNAKFISFDELDFYKKFEPLNINEIKDVDSIVGALQERIYYAGNITLGNSKFVEDSSDIHNSSYLLEAENVFDSKYIGYTRMARSSERMFGCNATGDSKYTVRGLELWHTSRCFDVFEVRYVSDCYYSFNIEGSQDCLFSFNLKKKKYCIGNLELEKETYLKQKEKLLEEIRDSLRSRKKVVGITDILNQAKDRSSEVKDFFEKVSKKAKYRKEYTDMSKIDKTFGDTSSILLGKRLDVLKDYEPWLSSHVSWVKFHKSAISGRKTGIVGYSRFDRFPRSRIVTVDEAPLLADLKLNEEEALSISLASAPEYIGKIAYSTADADIQNSMIMECCMIGNSSNCYRCFTVPYTKNSGCSFWPKGTDNAFGCNSVHDSAFVMNSYFSSRISRAFEVDMCRDSVDIYFSHNCEAMQDALFCFNTKNLRRAIGNTEYSLDEYKKVKGALLEQISIELEKNKSIKWDIYNIGCAGRGK